MNTHTHTHTHTQCARQMSDLVELDCINEFWNYKHFTERLISTYVRNGSVFDCLCSLQCFSAVDEVMVFFTPPAFVSSFLTPFHLIVLTHRLTRPAKPDKPSPLRRLADVLLASLPPYVVASLGAQPLNNMSYQCMATFVSELRVAAVAQAKLSLRIILAAAIADDADLAREFMLSELHISDPRSDTGYGALFWMLCHRATVGRDGENERFIAMAARPKRNNDDDGGEEDADRCVWSRCVPGVLFSFRVGWDFVFGWS